jgi:acyl carrier protein
MKLKTIPVGRPIANTQIYILDPHLNPVPIGIPGELYVGGTSVGRGYLNRPELTQAKFIPHPFSSHAGDRLYKTDDLARYLPDGNIEFLGRIDNQVKIRGFRIELGEIESALNSHHHIQQAVVMAREDVSGNKQLVAYLVSSVESCSTQQLREFLQQQLPAYMVPSAFVILDTLPLTPNGKVDRKALPIPDFIQLQGEEYVAPRNEVEEILVEIWAEILSLESIGIGIHANFFELGGHSLLATQIVSRINKELRVEVSLQNLFEENTIAALAKRIEKTQWIRQELQIHSVISTTTDRVEEEL